MKKLIIALALVAAAASSQAAHYTWRLGGTAAKIYQPESTSATLGGANIYVFDQSAYSQVALLNALSADNANYTSILKENSLYGDTYQLGSSGNFKTATPVDTIGTEVPGEGGNNFAHNYAAVLYTDAKGTHVYLTSVVDTLIPEGDSDLAELEFGSQGASQGKAAEYVKTRPLDPDHVSAGWYTVSGGSSPEPTPEPTSGLLLLLGVAGLSLRRKQK